MVLRDGAGRGGDAGGRLRAVAGPRLGASAVDLATWHATLSTACQAARDAERPLSTPDEHPRPDTNRPAPTLSEGLTPEQVVELLNEWFAEATRAIRRHGGVVDKFIGDAIMAVFGVPGRRDDATADAVRAAIEMRDALASLNLRRRALAQREFQVGIGINTGEAVVGFIGSHLQQSFAAIGDVTNTASRLETATKDYPGCDILISQATEDVQRRLGVAETTFLGLAALKGKEQKVPVYQVIGPREPRAATNALSQSPVLMRPEFFPNRAWGLRIATTVRERRGGCFGRSSRKNPASSSRMARPDARIRRRTLIQDLDAPARFCPWAAGPGTLRIVSQDTGGSPR